MSKLLLPGPAFVALACGALSSLTVAGGPKAETSQSFKINIVAHMVTEADAKKQTMDAQTDSFYTWRRKGAERILSYDGSSSRVSVDGNEVLNVAMSRSKFVITKQGKQEEVLLEKAPKELKNLLQDSFEVPLCKLEVDDNGKEVKRTILAAPGAKPLLDNGMIANALIFHPPVMAGQDRWEAPNEISMSNGVYARGKLTYQKAAATKEGQSYSVTGTLTNPGFKATEVPQTIKDVRYLVRGEQTYDPTRKEWVSGKLVIDASFMTGRDETALVPSRGTITITFTALPAKK